MSQPLGRDSVRDLTPEEVARGLIEGRIMLVDVREPNETDIERYPDAVLLRWRARSRTPIPAGARSSLPAGRATVR